MLILGIIITASIDIKTIKLGSQMNEIWDDYFYPEDHKWCQILITNHLSELSLFVYTTTLVARDI